MASKLIRCPRTKKQSYSAISNEENFYCSYFMNRGTEKQVNLKETFEEAAAREWRENHPEHENYYCAHAAQSPIVVASASNAAASKGITNMDIDDEAASKEANSGS